MQEEMQQGLLPQELGLSVHYESSFNNPSKPEIAQWYAERLRLLYSILYRPL